MKIAVLGDGGWGTTLSLLLDREGHSVTLWGAFSEYVDYLKTHRENVKFLPDVQIPDTIDITHDLRGTVETAEAVVVAVPAQHIREVIGRLAGLDVQEKVFVSATKGVENESLKRISEIIIEVLGETLRLVVLSGPSIALEVANGMPATIVVASADKKLARTVQELFFSQNLRVYTSDDVIGVELGGAVKNIIAIAAGICEGLGFGSNSKSALMVRGMVEMQRLGAALGAKPQTFWGLSGIGDLITTCISPYGRNRWFGEEIGRGKTPRQALQETEMVVEGYTTTSSVYELARRHGVDMPITEKMYEILYRGKSPREAVGELMARDPKDE